MSGLVGSAVFYPDIRCVDLKKVCRLASERFGKHKFGGEGINL